MEKTNKNISQYLTDDGFTIITNDVSPQKKEDTGIDDAEKELIEHISFMIKKVPSDAEKKAGELHEPKEWPSETAEPVSESRTKTIEVERPEITSIIEYLNWHMERIAKYVVGRIDVVRQAMFAILTGEHLLLLSRTGMAKSYLANYIFSTFDDARVFSSQASKDQTPDNYFGPYNIEEFKKGRIRHNIKGSIIEANLVFLDEFFDASDVVLRSLLSVLNERKFINGSEQIDVSIHSAIATANYMRLNEVTEAILDRFVYKAILPEDKNVYSQLQIDQTYAQSGGRTIEPAQRINFNQILYLSEIIRNNHKTIRIIIPENVFFMKNIIINRYVSEIRKYDSNYFISPRKQAKMADFLRAVALLANRYEVLIEDLKEMHLSLCTLNSYVTVNTRDKLESELFLDVYQNTMVHFKTTGALEQINYLLSIRNILEEIKVNPERQKHILEKKGVLEGLLELFKLVFPTKKKVPKEITVESLKKSVFEVNPVIEEVSELQKGILREYRDLDLH